MAESMRYVTFIISARDSSKKVYTARCKLQNILCEYLLTSLPRARAGSCDGITGSAMLLVSEPLALLNRRGRYYDS